MIACLAWGSDNSVIPPGKEVKEGRGLAADSGQRCERGDMDRFV